MKPARKGRYLRHASLAAKPLMRSALATRGFGESRLLTEWHAVAGPKTAELARPLRVSFAAREGLGGTLVLGVLGSRALELQHMLPQIIERVNAHYGYRAIARIRIEQVGAEMLQATKEDQSAPQPCPEASARIKEALTPVRNDDLRAALETLGDHIAARSAGKSARTDKKE